jgi:hypothetical protein
LWTKVIWNKNGTKTFTFTAEQSHFRVLHQSIEHVCQKKLLFGDSRWLDLSTWPAQATFILQCWFPDPTEIGDATTPASSISTAEGRVLARLWQSSLAELCRQCRPLSPRAAVGS